VREQVPAPKLATFKLDADAVYAVSEPSWGSITIRKDVTEVTTAFGASHLNSAHAKRGVLVLSNLRLIQTFIE
jgi:hypothetical protein